MIYEWRCKSCGNVVGLFTTSFDDYDKPPVKPCEDCEEEEWEKIMSKTNFRWRFND